MKHVNSIVIALLILCVMSCSLIEDSSEKTYREKTIELMTGVWNVDSLTKYQWSVSTPETDSLFLNYGTIEFQSPDAAKIPFGNHGYAIHKYTRKGQQVIDTLAWEPFGAGIREDEPAPLDDFSIWYENPYGNTAIYTDDWEIAYNFRIREKNKVNASGYLELVNLNGGTTYAIFRYTYHLTR